MSGKGGCYYNAMGETVFKTIKNELIWRTSFQTRKSCGTGLWPTYRRLLQSRSATFRIGIQIANLIRGRNGHHRMKASPHIPGRSNLRGRSLIEE